MDKQFLTVVTNAHHRTEEGERLCL